MSGALAALACATGLGVWTPGPLAPPWGRHGHEIAARAAAAILPDIMPVFFRDAADELVYLDPEPDRWHGTAFVEMDRAWAFDHYIDLENVPEDALDAPDRFTYLRALHDAGLDVPERDGGFLPFRIVELYQRLVTEWRRWHAEADPERRRWIETRIVADAGILGHYVTDGSQPQHTTIHYDGWAADAPNPEAYTEERGFHGRFEVDFVDAHVTRRDVEERLPRRPRFAAGSLRASVLAYLLDTHAHVSTLYRIERDVGFDPDRPPDPTAKAFAADRLAAGAAMLAELWWSAYLEGRGDR